MFQKSILISISVIFLSGCSGVPVKPINIKEELTKTEKRDIEKKVEYNFVKEREREMKKENFLSKLHKSAVDEYTIKYTKKLSEDGLYYSKYQKLRNQIKKDEEKKHIQKIELQKQLLKEKQKTICNSYIKNYKANNIKIAIYANAKEGFILKNNNQESVKELEYKSIKKSLYLLNSIETVCKTTDISLRKIKETEPKLKLRFKKIKEQLKL